MSMRKSVFDLKIHEQIEIVEKINEMEKFGLGGHSTIKVTRVPGGWIYTMDAKDSVFVPFMGYNND